MPNCVSSAIWIFWRGSGAQRIPAPFRVRVVMALVVRQRLGQLPGVGSPSDPKSRRSMCLRPNAHTERDQNRSAAGLATLAAALALGGAGRLAGAREVARATAGTLRAQDAIAHEARRGALQALGVLAESCADLLEPQAGVRGDEGLQVAGGLDAGGRGLAASPARGSRGGGGRGRARAARSARAAAFHGLAQRVERRLAHAP